DPRNDAVVHGCRQAEQQAADDDAGVVVGNVGELRAADDVADGQHAAVRGCEPLAHLDAALVVFDGRRLQVEAGDVGLAPGGNEQVRALHHVRPVALGNMNVDEPGAAADALHGRALTDLQPFRLQALDDDL